LFSKTEFHYVIETGLKFKILLSQPPRAGIPDMFHNTQCKYILLLSGNGKIFSNKIQNSEAIRKWVANFYQKPFCMATHLLITVFRKMGSLATCQPCDETVLGGKEPFLKGTDMSTYRTDW
jgi:hypothetical protein